MGGAANTCIGGAFLTPGAHGTMESMGIKAVAGGSTYTVFGGQS
jgi:hypothetical protein